MLPHEVVANKDTCSTCNRSCNRSCHRSCRSLRQTLQACEDHSAIATEPPKKKSGQLDHSIFQVGVLKLRIGLSKRGNLRNCSFPHVHEERHKTNTEVAFRTMNLPPFFAWSTRRLRKICCRSGVSHPFHNHGILPPSELQGLLEQTTEPQASVEGKDRASRSSFTRRQVCF